MADRYPYSASIFRVMHLEVETVGTPKQWNNLRAGRMLFKEVFKRYTFKLLLLHSLIPHVNTICSHSISVKLVNLM
jgi:hypothetical protein